MNSDARRIHRLEYDDKGIRPLTQREFALLQAEVYRESGIFLPDSKQALLIGRLRHRLRRLGLRSFGDYYRRIRSDVKERREMLDCICTNETRFFREPRHFEFIEWRAIPEWTAAAKARRRSKRLRIWSAACSTGEEPYSLAMVLLRHLPPSDGWKFEILATDISTRALTKAREGLWPIEKAADIPLEYLRAFMLRGERDRAVWMKVGPEARSVVRFERFNLHRGILPGDGCFDLIFCRNVLMFFDEPARAAAVALLARRLVAGGYLFVGHAESLFSGSDRLRSVEPTIYVRADSRGAMRRKPAAAGSVGVE